MMTDSIFDLTGKMAVITGGGTGLGKQFAHVLSKAGATVVLCARRVEKLEEAVAEINDAGGKAHCCAMDVTDAASIAAAFDQAEYNQKNNKDGHNQTNNDKENVTHQYCIGDTIMLTYQEQNYSSNFDYYGMTYQFWKKQSDADWKVEDTFFKPVVGDTLCHITNRSNYHVMNVLATDTHTWYKIVATCQFDGKEYHSDSLLVNVNTTIFSAGVIFSAINRPVLETKTVVLPDPAPARISIGPVLCFTASICSGLSPSNHLFFLDIKGESFL